MTGKTLAANYFSTHTRAHTHTHTHTHTYTHPHTHILYTDATDCITLHANCAQGKEHITSKTKHLHRGYMVGYHVMNNY